MTDRIIREYVSSDFAGITELWTRTGLGGALRGDDAEVISRTIDHGGVFLVMEDVPACRIIGSSWMTNDFRRLYLHHFGILPEYQRQGLAKELLSASLARAKSVGLQIKLEVHRNNQAAIALYKSFGFNALGEYDSFIIRDLSVLNDSHVETEL